MGVTLIRQNSDTPNVSNTDDARMIRFAYGGRDGVVKGYGQECAYTVNGKTFSIGSGCIVLQGWEVRLDANGWSINIQSTGVARKYRVYLEINLATQTAAIKTIYATGSSYPTINNGDDLTRNTSGVASFSLYLFSAAADGTITDASNIALNNVRKLFSVLDYDPTVKIQEDLNALSARVEELGFKTGVATVSSDWTLNYREEAVVNTLQKQGKYCIFNIILYAASIYPNANVELSLLDGFKPKIDLQGVASVTYRGYLESDPNQTEKNISVAINFSILTDGKILIPVANPQIAGWARAEATTVRIVNVGWEIQ